jgi:hypothetical protein
LSHYAYSPTCARDCGRPADYGGTAVNLDLTTENAVQDRWYALGGGEGGEVRVRLAVVAGGPEDDATQEVLDFCCSQLGSTSRAALLVEVRGHRWGTAGAHARACAHARVCVYMCV